MIPVKFLIVLGLGSCNPDDVAIDYIDDIESQVYDILNKKNNDNDSSKIDTIPNRFIKGLPDSLRLDINARSSREFPLFACHAGYRVVGPPNSLPSFIGAGITGFWGCETDIRITSDNIVVCFHDKSLEESTNGIGFVNEITFDELQHYKYNDKSNKYTHYDYKKFTENDLRIVTIDEFFDICNKYKMVPILDMKSWKAYPKTLEAIKRHGLQGKCIIQSSLIEQLHLVRQYGYDERILLYWAHSSNIDELLDMGNASISFKIPDLDADLNGSEDYGDYHPRNARELIYMCNDLGIPANITGTNDVDIAKRLVDMGVRFIISDYLFNLEYINTCIQEIKQ